MRATPARLAALIALCALACCAVAFAWPTRVRSGVAHYEYVASAGRLYVYDIDRRPLLVGSSALPGVRGIRGIAASAATGMLYVSYAGSPSGGGHLLEFSLRSHRIVYARSYRFGIDSFDITHDGRLIFMPTGEDTSGHTWHVLAAATGRVVGAITAGRSPHDTVVAANGHHVFLGGASARYLYEADSTRPWRIAGRIGPLEPAGIAGIRPFTVKADESLAFTTGDRYLGFQVSDVASGRVLYSVAVPGFTIPRGDVESVDSHGIGLSPDERYLWLLDAPHRAVHEFDISALPGRAPTLVATVHVSSRPGWLNLSRDGRYLFVGDAGTVIDTRPRRTVARLGALTRSRYNVEVDRSGPSVCAAYPRESLGYLHVAPQCDARTG
jgi:DNA-binding beta-propeller fold protein YncE